MVGNFRASFNFNSYGIAVNAPSAIGVYYLGSADYTGALAIYYIGKSIDVKSRLIEHIEENKWSDATHFGYCICSTDQEAKQLESSEINYYKPKYNIQDVRNY